LEYTDKALSDIDLNGKKKADLETIKTSVKAKSDSDFSLKKD